MLAFYPKKIAKMQALKEEIARKKRQLELASGGKDNDDDSGKKIKYVRQGDLERIERERYLKEQEELEKIRAEKQARENIP